MALAVADPECTYAITAKILASQADVIIHEFPYSEPIFADRRFAHKEIYNSHNFELSLIPAIVQGQGTEAAVLKLIRLEGNLAARATRVLATSQADAEKFRLIYGVPANRLALCPNGFDESELNRGGGWRSGLARHVPRRASALFLGSAHHPNVEGVESLIKMAPLVESCDFLIVGGVCNSFLSRTLPANVIMLGQVDEEVKNKLLNESDIFVNPIVLGSGTSLKALEALGAGIPLLSTFEGVRGLDLDPGIHAAIVDRRDFPEAIAVLLSAPERTSLMANAGRCFVTEHFTWSAIATGLRNDIERALLSPDDNDAADTKPLVLAFNDYPVLNGTSGGQARILNLLGNLDAEIVLVTFGPTFDVVRLGHSVMAVLVPKAEEHSSFETMANAGQPLSVNDCVASLFAGTNRSMRAVVAMLASRASAVILEHCYMAPVLDIVDAVRPGLPVIYSAHNVEARHRIHMLDAHSAGWAISPLVADIERELAARAALVVCCTATDAEHFDQGSAEIIVVPNGCLMPENEVIEPPRGSSAASVKVGFLGSSHGPNVDAARFILDELVPAFPDVLFEFIGGVGEAIGSEQAPNVVVHGIVDDLTKSEILSGWVIALNPITSGGGSSLKLPDFMAHALPTINTTQGARGFGVAEHGAGLVINLDEFRSAIGRLIADPAQRRSMSERAFAYARDHLSWAALTRPYATRLRALMATSDKGGTPVRRSLLVVTYRYTEPVLGGAEEYLTEVLKCVRHRFDRVDLAAIDVGRITNEHHFGCKIESSGVGASSRLTELFDRALFFPPIAPPLGETITRCRHLERAWMRNEFDLLLPFLPSLARGDCLRLLGGFYGPERHGGVSRRWTSPEFSLLLPSSASTLRLAGFAHRSKTIALTLLLVKDGEVPEVVAEHVQTLPSWFVINFSLPDVSKDATMVALVRVDVHEVEGDHRPLGLLLDSVSSLTRTSDLRTGRQPVEVLTEHPADFDDDWELDLRTEHFEPWVARLAAMARNRDDAAEADFAAVRGPHSPALQQWLSQHAGAYDSVLVQGIPFDVIPSTVETLCAQPERPRVVTLPHFHGDDRFYYWRRYLAAFDAADTSLLFSPSIAEALQRRGKFSIVPGGGVRPEEVGDVGAVAAFRAIHRSPTPFFLVLGRKTPSKGYLRAIAAQKGLHAEGHTVDLVLIGPDEDGKPVSGDGIHYHGRQPRTVVRGALRECAGLISMSSSESFGIVICEAWLFGRPVVANRACYASRDLVCHGKTGLLVGSDWELASAMRAILTEPGLGDAMGRSGQESLLDRFTWDRVSDQVYDACVGARSEDDRSSLVPPRSHIDRTPITTSALLSIATAIQSK